MRAILVDDERLALMQLRKMLTEITGVEVLDSFMDPSQAIQMVGELQPDVAFLDMHMPEIYGLKTAEMMQEVCPHIEIVFITAHDEYAIQAFELNALDYVLKPLRRERLVRTVQRLQQNVNSRKKDVEEAAEASTLIRCFQTLQIEVPGLGAEAYKWRTSKAEELFAYLLHHRGQLVRKGVLLELLWPSFDLKKATTHLYTTIYQVRQDLKRMDAAIEIRSVSMKDSYILDAANVRIDVEEWERDLARLDSVNAHNVHDHQRLMNLYAGDYLADFDYLWAENERQRLRTIWLQHAQLLGDFYAEHDMLSEAIHVYHQVQQQYPYYEDSYFSLMRLYERLEERAAVEEQYNRLSIILEEEMDTVPDGKIQMWYQQWREANEQL